MNDDGTCATCEALTYLNEWLIWDSVGEVIWADWPDDAEDDPILADAHWAVRPKAPASWLSGATDYDAPDVRKAVEFMICAVHGFPPPTDNVFQLFGKGSPA